MGRPWRVLRSDVVYSCQPFLTIKREAIELPDGRHIDDYHRIEVPDYTVIVALDRQGDVLCLEQYRHGPQRSCLMLPSGQFEPGETPLAAARRELREETGYVAEHWRSFGNYVVNANQGCGTAHFFVARGAHRIQDADPGDLEEMRFLTLSPQQLRTAIQEGRLAVLSHAAALGFWLAGEAFLVDD